MGLHGDDHLRRLLVVYTIRTDDVLEEDSLAEDVLKDVLAEDVLKDALAEDVLEDVPAEDVLDPHPQ